MKTAEKIKWLAVSLFSKAGYDGVSMRDIAESAGITPAALYYHFKNKDELYSETLALCFRTKIAALLNDIPDSGDAWVQLEVLIEKWQEMLHREHEFHRLMQWVYMDSNAERQAQLGKVLLTDFYEAISRIVSRVAPSYDAHQITLSVAALVSFPIMTSSLRSAVRGFDPEKETPANLTKHILSLFRHGAGAPENGSTGREKQNKGMARKLG